MMQRTCAARTAYERYLAIMREVHDEREESVALIRLAGVSEDMGELDAAESRYREALAITRRISGPSDLADTLLLAGHFLTQHERGGDEGRQLLAEAAAIYTRLGRAGHAEYARALTDGPAVNAAPAKTAAAHIADHRKRSRRMRRARRARQVATAMQMSESWRVRHRVSKPARPHPPAPSPARRERGNRNTSLPHCGEGAGGRGWRNANDPA